MSYTTGPPPSGATQTSGGRIFVCGLVACTFMGVMEHSLGDRTAGNLARSALNGLVVAVRVRSRPRHGIFTRIVVEAKSVERRMTCRSHLAPRNAR